MGGADMGVLALTRFLPSPTHAVVKSVARRHYRRQKLNLQEHFAAFDLDSKAFGAAFVWLLRTAGIETDNPLMQRARDFSAEYDSLRQRPAFVRALVTQRKHFIFGVPKNGDIAALGFNDPRAQAWNVVNTANLCPFAVTQGRLRLNSGSKKSRRHLKT